MSLDLRPEIEEAIRERAAAEGVSVNDLLALRFMGDLANGQSASDPRERVRALLRKWRSEDDIPPVPPVETIPGETPTQALFRKWAEEDANMTPEEIEAEDRFWEEFQQGINETRNALGMRTLF